MKDVRMETLSGTIPAPWYDTKIRDADKVIAKKRVWIESDGYPFHLGYFMRKKENVTLGDVYASIRGALQRNAHLNKTFHHMGDFAIERLMVEKGVDGDTVLYVVFGS